MKSNVTELLSFMQSSNFRFIIPIYQRRYSWTIENCEKLLADLKKVELNGLQNHFFGCVVSSTVTCGSKIEYHIIDGQQRITTVFLLLLVIRDIVKRDHTRSNNENRVDEINNDFIIVHWDRDDDRIKLEPYGDDKTELDRIVKYGIDGDIGNSNFVTNYKYFYDKLSNMSLDDLYNAIKKLDIICATVEDGDKPQLIFESLNTTGMVLTEADKIRNYILMGLPANTQSQFYQDYWVKIELCAGKENLDRFVRDFMSVKQQTLSKLENVYRDFKKYAEKRTRSRTNSISLMEELLKEMLKYAKFYEKLRVCNSEFDNADEMDYCLRRLKKLDITVLSPFLMRVLCHRAENRLKSDDDVLQIFLVVESYIVRKKVCGDHSTLDKTFISLDREIVNYDGTTENYVSKLRYALTTKKFPDNTQFRQALENVDVYNGLSAYKAYMLERFENYNTKERHDDIYIKLESNPPTYSIEHIMPQDISNWYAYLRQECAEYGTPEEIQNKWVHNLANLTLTGYNSELQNKAFIEKRDDKNYGYKYSGLRLNRWISEQESWGPAQLKARQEFLVNDAINIWEYPSLDYDSNELLQECTLADDTDLTNREIVKFSFLNENNVTCNDMANFFTRVISMLFAFDSPDSHILSQIAEHKAYNRELWKKFSYNRQELHSAVDIGGGIFVSTNSSSKVKKATLCTLFDLYHVDKNSLKFYLKGDYPKIDRISNAIKKWINTRYDINVDLENSDRTRTIFSTSDIESIVPDNKIGIPSERQTRNHCFYEVANEDGRQIYIRLVGYSTGASEKFVDFCEIVSDIYQTGTPLEKWKCCMLYRTSSVKIEDEVSENNIIAGLNRCIDEIKEFEKNLKVKIELLYS